jgi:hypothetical protein
VVFIGKVIIVADPEFSAGGIPHRVVSLERQITAGFIVEKVYRGAAFEEVEVSSKSGGLEFGHDFNVGERYLVYAEGVDNAGVEELVVKGCGRTRLIKDADEDLHFLNEPSQPTETGKVHGHSR